MVTIIFILQAIIWLYLLYEGKAGLESTGTIAYVLFGAMGFYYTLMSLFGKDKLMSTTMLAIFFFLVGMVTMLLKRGVL